VLKGAASLAIPLKLGQSLEVSAMEELSFNKILWKAFSGNTIWFETEINPAEISIVKSSNAAIAEQLRMILQAANTLNPHIIEKLNNHQITTKLDFDINWGLGSSSTLISNIAQLFQINPFSLYFKVANGSGYDVACATAKTPIIYTLINGNPIIEPVDFNPPFSENIFFVYLGKKQKSDASINKYSDKLENCDEAINMVSELTLKMASSQTLDEFEAIIFELEKITSKILGIPTANEKMFGDFGGAVKSLGAWGGDFVMLTWRSSAEALAAYLTKKGFNTFFRYNDFVLYPTSDTAALF
jgi:mevalonate kinase